MFIDAPEAFVVVVEQYTDHPEGILKQTVSKRSFAGYNCFLLADQAAVEEAKHGGVICLTDTTPENPF